MNFNYIFWSQVMKEENEIINQEKDQVSQANNSDSSVSLEEEQKQKIASLEQGLASVNDKLLRALAENDNLRRRSKEELEKANKYAISNFANDLVVIMENFYLAVDNMPIGEIEKSSVIKNFADAIVMTKKELTKVFDKNDIRRIYPLNEKFDYNYHEAVSRVPSDLDEDSVVQVVQAGYLIGDRLIRPALVTVSARKVPDSEN